MEELKMTSKIKSLISIEENLIPLSNRVLNINHKDYLNKFFYINLGLVHYSLCQIYNNKTDKLNS